MNIRVLLVLPLLLFLTACTKQKAKSTSQTYYLHLDSEPTTLNPITSTDTYASAIQSRVMDTLLSVNIDTYELEPNLAERWEAGPNDMSYTFYIRKGVKFHDGKPLTAKDVKFSFDAILDPEFDTAHIRPYLENIKSATLIDDYTIRFDIKKKYFNNLRVLATYFDICPQHVYGDPKKKVNKTIVGSGPYTWRAS